MTIFAITDFSLFVTANQTGPSNQHIGVSSTQYIRLMFHKTLSHSIGKDSLGIGHRIIIP